MPLTRRQILAFCLASLLLGELHELVHVWPGAAVCGGFGARDFNSWSLREGCLSVVPTALGPLFTYGVALAAAWMLCRPAGAPPVRALLLLFASGLFGRLLTTALGGGDEVQVARALLPPALAPQARWLALAVVLVCIAWPLWVAFGALGRKPLRFMGLLLLPFVVAVVVVLLGLNTVLGAGVLAAPELAGAPPLVHLYGLLLLAASPFIWRALVPASPLQASS